MSEPYDADYQKRIAKRLAQVPSIKPYRPTREEWVCPNCGLNGDHMKVPISTKRCKGCCATDAAAEMLDALRAVVSAKNDQPTHEVMNLVRAAIAKAEGRDA